MDYLQYLFVSSTGVTNSASFKPYYKWITFNTEFLHSLIQLYHSFKPYYKWITFNTSIDTLLEYVKDLKF